MWVLDLSSKTTRALTSLIDQSATRTFDITPDGTAIVFDRLRENSDVVLLDRPQYEGTIAFDEGRRVSSAPLSRRFHADVR